MRGFDGSSGANYQAVVYRAVNWGQGLFGDSDVDHWECVDAKFFLRVGHIAPTGTSHIC
jgi:hypothetical protein